MIARRLNGLVGNVRYVRSLLGQALGLMFRSRLIDEVWVFVFKKRSHWHITNVFVFQTIDVIWLAQSQEVTQIATLSPFTLHAQGVPETAFVVEAPKGFCKRHDICVGQRLLVI